MEAGRVSEPEFSAGQVWHFYCDDVPDCDNYYLLLRALPGFTMTPGGEMLGGLWEAFDLVEGERLWVSPCAAGVWELMA